MARVTTKKTTRKAATKKTATKTTRKAPAKTTTKASAKAPAVSQAKVDDYAAKLREERLVQAKKDVVGMPQGIEAFDLTYPEWNPKKPDELVREIGEYGALELYDTTGFGWCIATLGIRKARSAGKADRTYAIRVSDGQPVRIGLGPHVKRTVKVYVRQSRLEALKKYVDLYNKGSETAHEIRDRISTRRAQGALRRSSWMGY